MTPVGCVGKYPWHLFKRFGPYYVALDLPHITKPQAKEIIVDGYLRISRDDPKMWGMTKTLFWLHGAVNVLKRPGRLPLPGAWSTLTLKGRTLFHVGRRAGNFNWR